MKILTADIQNTYLHADCREKIYTIGGPEFGSNEGKALIISKALYGLKTSGAAFRSLLAEQLDLIGYTASRGDPDVWMRPCTYNKVNFYEYVLVYVDDLFCVSFDPYRTMDQLSERFTFKEGSIKSPDSFLGAQLSHHEKYDCWTISATNYINAASQTIASKVKARKPEQPFYHYPLTKMSCKQPIASHYRPEEDGTPLLDDDNTTFFQEIIGILRWAVELGRVDILLEISLLSSHLSLPREGQLFHALRVLSYLHYNPSCSLYMEPTDPNISEDRFYQADWTDFYRHSKQLIPDDAPTPLGQPVRVHCFVDSNHASDKVTRKSQTGILIFINSAPIIWYSKKQNCVESSTLSIRPFLARRRSLGLKT
jgi:Reverse transcriptase (RNA-dependent DNA polymerase)